MDELLEEMKTDILERLPTQDVVRAKVVCKTWRKIINNPKFLSRLLSREAKAEPPSTFLFLPRNEDHPTYIVQKEQERPLVLFPVTKNNFRCPEKSEEFSRNCVNGLFCFGSLCSGKSRISTRIFNPVTRDIVELPHIFAPCMHYIWGCMSAFVFDKSRNEYKVIHLYCVRSNFDNNGHYPDARIHVLGTNCWRKIANYPYISRYRTKTVAEIRGTLHWLTMYNILTFDVVSEKFGTIQLHPEFDVHPLTSTKNRVEILNLGGCLSIVVYIFDVPGNPYIDIWIMKDYDVKESWAKFKIQYPSQCFHKMPFKKILPLSFKNETGEIFFYYGSKIVSYDTKIRQFGIGMYQVLSDKSGCLSKYSFDIYPFIMNLVSLPRVMEN